MADEREGLDDRRALLEAILDSVGVGVVVADTTGRFTLWNSAAVEIVGMEAVDEPPDRWPETYGVFLSDGKTPCPAEELPLVKALRGIATDGDLQFLRNAAVPHGVWVRVTGRPVRDAAGTIRAAVVAFQDVGAEMRSHELLDQAVKARTRELEDEVARRQDAERRLLHAQKLEAVGRLAGGIAHDFNNVLSVILSYGTFVRDSLADGDPVRLDVDAVLDAAAKAADLTRQLLAFSRQAVMEPRVLDLNGLVASLDRLLRRVLGEDIEIVTHHDPELGLTRIDPSHFEQVLVNLAVNARDAMPGGGKLTIETANVTLGDDYVRSHPGVTPGPYVMLAVSDNGSGIAPEIREHIFEPFFTTKDHGKGTGLGLATCYGIVKQAGGDIWVYTEPGRGTTFKIYLPRVDGREEPLASTPEEVTVPRGTETILVVEDDAAVRASVVRNLERLGYTVLTAETASEAIAIAGKEGVEIKLLLTDVVLPTTNGRALAAAVWGLWPHIRVLYTSGYTEDAIVHHGVLDPGLSFLQKPFRPEALAFKVRAILDGPEGNARP